jgi:hypothetical protein
VHPKGRDRLRLVFTRRIAHIYSEVWGAPGVHGAWQAIDASPEEEAEARAGW